MVYTVNTLSSATYPFSNFSPRKDGNLNSSRILLLEKKTSIGKKQLTKRITTFIIRLLLKNDDEQHGPKQIIRGEHSCS